MHIADNISCIKQLNVSGLKITLFSVCSHPNADEKGLFPTKVRILIDTCCATIIPQLSHALV